MSAANASILIEIENERYYQDRRFGHEFDNRNTLNDWATYLGIYTAKATEMGKPSAKQREALVKVAAIAVAAIEAFDRNVGFPSRHYDVPGVTSSKIGL